MKQKQTTRRNFLQAMGAVAFFGDGGDDEGSLWNKYFGDDETGKPGEYSLLLGTKEEFENTEAQEKTAFKIVPDGPVYRAVDDPDSLISGKSKWEKIPSTGANPTFESAEIGDLQDKSSGNSYDVDSLAGGGIDPTAVSVSTDTGWDTYDPADYADLFAALNQVMTDVSDSEQVTIHLPFTGPTGVSAGTQFSVPSGQVPPNITGWGPEGGTVINWTDTSGTAAIDKVDSTNDTDFRWTGFKLDGPGQGSASGDAMLFSGNVNHTVEVDHIHVANFGGRGIAADSNFLTGSIHHCSVIDCGSFGMDVSRANGAQIHDNIVYGCAATAQVRILNTFWAQFYSNDVDSKGQDASINGHGLVIDSGGSRTGSFVLGNYFEDNDNHVRIQNDSGGTPTRGSVVMANSMRGGNHGVRFAGGNDCHVVANWFQSLGTSDITLDTGGAILGANSHHASTTKITDNSTGGYNAYASTTTYPW